MTIKTLIKIWFFLGGVAYFSVGVYLWELIEHSQFSQMTLHDIILLISGYSFIIFSLMLWAFLFRNR